MPRTFEEIWKFEHEAASVLKTLTTAELMALLNNAIEPTPTVERIARVALERLLEIEEQLPNLGIDWHID